MILTYSILNRSRKGGGAVIVDVVSELVESSWGHSDSNVQEPHSLQATNWAGNCRAWLRSRGDVKRNNRLPPRFL